MTLQRAIQPVSGGRSFAAADRVAAPGAGPVRRPRVPSFCSSASGSWNPYRGKAGSWQSSPHATTTGGIARMHITPLRPTTPSDIASLCLWKQEQAGDNQDRIRRPLSNLPLAVHQELTPRRRQILQMRFTGGMSVTAIAKELRLNKSTVSRSLNRSMERLYKSLRYSL